MLDGFDSRQELFEQFCDDLMELADVQAHISNFLLQELVLLQLLAKLVQRLIRQI